jgi:hypothetical protein
VEVALVEELGEKEVEKVALVEELGEKEVALQQQLEVEVEGVEEEQVGAIQAVEETREAPMADWMEAWRNCLVEVDWQQLQ